MKFMPKMNASPSQVSTFSSNQSVSWKRTVVPFVPVTNSRLSNVILGILTMSYPLIAVAVRILSSRPTFGRRNDASLMGFGIVHFEAPVSRKAGTKGTLSG